MHTVSIPKQRHRWPVNPRPGERSKKVYQIYSFVRLPPNHLVGVLNTRQISLLDTFDRQRRDQRRAHAGPIFRGANIYRIPLARGPVQDLPQCLRPTGFEMGIFVENAAVGAHVA